MKLTQTELEVLRLLARGMTNAAMATKRNVSLHTINHQVSSIIFKLRADDRNHAVIIARREGII